MILRLVLPLLLGGVGAALAISLYLLNDFHRAQLESRLYGEVKTFSPNNKQLHFVLDLTKENFFIIVPRLNHIFFLPSKDKIIKVVGTHQTQATQTIERIVHSRTLYQELRAIFVALFWQSLFIITFFALTLFFIVRHFYLRPLTHLINHINDFHQNPEGEQILIPQKNKTPLAQAEETLAAMEKELKQKFQEQTRLAHLGLSVNKISHDLRNILSSAQLLSDSLSQSASKAQKPSFQRLSASLSRSIALCGQYLKYMRSTEPSPQFSLVMLAPLVKEVGDAIRMQNPKCQWQSTLDRELALNSDSDFLFRILFNLGKNAAQAGADIIATSTQVEKNKITLRFKDNGGGLPLRVRSNLFMPFVSGNKEKGYGLGLSIAQELARALGGNLALEQTNAQGTTFCLTLPNT